ncbi:hypothetical protein V9T40_003294 [Parthenolecanium corni]|uniref:Uncharacterized protein n=1 Tax=Parthenolecanium corni TaxID=536013 RepID=A0AAN9TV21_9HEMI
MFTLYNDIPLEKLDSLGEEIEEDLPKSMKVAASQIQIKTFHIPFRIFDDVTTSRRAFGEVAEVYFLSKTYGFFDLMRTYWKLKKLILIMQHLRRGYEINVETMNRKMSNNRNKEMCLNHIKTNIHLAEQGIFIREDLINSVVKWEIKHIKFPFLERNFDDLQHDRNRKLLKCPAYFDEKKWPDEKHEYLYLLPIFYKIPIKSQKLFTFVEYLDSSNTVRPIMLTSVNPEGFEHYGDDEFIGADESYGKNEEIGDERDTETISNPTDIPSTSQTVINLMDQ